MRIPGDARTVVRCRIHGALNAARQIALSNFVILGLDEGLRC